MRGKPTTATVNATATATATVVRQMWKQHGEPKYLDLVRNNHFLKHEDGRGKFQGTLRAGNTIPGRKYKKMLDQELTT